jgi:putative SOS response-associated peptidase YedK
MCNRIRGLKEWSDIPRSLTRSLINFEYNPNVAPTEQVPAFLAERGKPLATRMARFGINLASSGGKRRPPCSTPARTRCDAARSRLCSRISVA